MIPEMHRETLMAIRPLIQQHIIQGTEILNFRPIDPYAYNQWVNSVYFDLNSWIVDVPYGLKVFNYYTAHVPPNPSTDPKLTTPTPNPRFSYIPFSEADGISSDAGWPNEGIRPDREWPDIYDNNGQYFNFPRDHKPRPVPPPPTPPTEPLTTEESAVQLLKTQIRALESIYRRINRETVPTGSIVFW